jgi:hypothetical protein
VKIDSIVRATRNDGQLSQCKPLDSGQIRVRLRWECGTDWAFCVAPAAAAKAAPESCARSGAFRSCGKLQSVAEGGDVLNTLKNSDLSFCTLQSLAVAALRTLCYIHGDLSGNRLPTAAETRIESPEVLFCADRADHMDRARVRRANM